jgi:type I restriction enzyme S subunit
VASTGYAQLRARESSEFLYQLIHSDNFVDKVISRCTGTSYPAINSSDLANISILLPVSRKEQEKIADFLTAIDRKIEAISRQIEGCDRFKQGLLQKLFV